MEYIQIPNLKVKVSRIGLGTWSIGGWMWGGSDEKESIQTIHKALDSQINLIDTAPVYGFGTSEEIVGKALKQYGKRDKIVIATKVGIGWKDDQPFRDSRKESIFKEIEVSLKRLQVDYIDIYQVHWPDPLTKITETAEAMNELLKQGKIRTVGVSNYSIQQMEEFQKTCLLNILQPPYNMFEREIENKELAYSLKNHIATLGYGSLCRGLLTGKMQKGRKFEGDDLRKVDPKFQEPRLSQYISCANKLQQFAKEKYGRSLLSLAVRWVLDKGISSALWGARKPDQLIGIEDCFGWKLSDADFVQIDSIIKETVTSPVGPEFMAPPARK